MSLKAIIKTFCASHALDHKFLNYYTEFGLTVDGQDETWSLSRIEEFLENERDGEITSVDKILEAGVFFCLVNDAEYHEKIFHLSHCIECGCDLDVHWEYRNDEKYGFGNIGHMVCKECLENFPYLECDQCGEIYDPVLGGTPLPDDPTGEEKYLCPNCLNKQRQNV